ncbi:MAG: hypothetical protein ACXABF_09365 [Candidatus Thorarchaeota archaeon]
MESSIRGEIEKYIDSYVREEFISAHIQRWRLMRENGNIDSIESSLLGQIYGGCLRFLCNILAMEENQLDERMVRDLNKVFESRMMGAKDRIMNLLRDTLAA